MRTSTLRMSVLKTFLFSIIVLHSMAGLAYVHGGTFGRRWFQAVSFTQCETSVIRQLPTSVFSVHAASVNTSIAGCFMVCDAVSFGR